MLKKYLQKADAFKNEAHRILGVHELSKSRIVNLEETYKKITCLTIKQDDLFRQALTCAERECFRAAHVMAWAAFMDFIEEKLCEDGFKKINLARQNWKINSIDDLRDVGSDYQIIETLKLVNLCSKTEMKALHGLLNHRNECAHPTGYFPGLNETLGFISELIKRLSQFQKRKLISSSLS